MSNVNRDANAVSSARLREEARKSWNYFISDEVVYEAELRDAERIKPQEGYVKDYIEGRLWFEVVALGVGNQELKLVWLVEVCPRELVVATEPNPDFPTDRSDNPMLVFVRQLGEDAEKFEFRPIRSVVRLKPFNIAKRLRRQKADIVGAKPSKRGLSGCRYAQGETDTPFLPLVQDDTVVGSVLHRKRPSDVVKRSSEITKDIANNQSPSQTDPRIDVDIYEVGAYEEIARVAQKLQLALSADGDFWLARGTTDSSIEATDVYIRPFNLEAGASKRVFRRVQPRQGMAPLCQ